MKFSFKEVLNLYNDDDVIIYSIPMYFKHRFDVQMVDFSIVQNFAGYKHFDIIHYVRYGQQFQRLADRNYENFNNYKKTAEESNNAARFCSFYTVETQQGTVKLEFVFQNPSHGATTFIYLAPALVKRLVKVEHYQRNSKGEWERVDIIPAKIERYNRGLSAEELGYEMISDNSSVTTKTAGPVGSNVVVNNVSDGSTVNVVSKGEVHTTTANLSNDNSSDPDVKSQQIIDALVDSIDLNAKTGNN